MVEAVIGITRAAPQVEVQVVNPLSCNVALIAARVDLGTIGLAVCTSLDFIVGSGIGGVRGLNVEADKVVGRRLCKGILGQGVGDWSTLVVVGSWLAGGDGHDGDGEEESGNCGEKHGGGEWDRRRVDWVWMLKNGLRVGTDAKKLRSSDDGRV